MNIKVINSIVFVPEESRRLATLIALDPIDEIKNKIKENPMLRDEISFGANLSNISNNKPEEIESSDISLGEKPKKQYQGKKTIIKNLTDGTVCLNFGETDRTKKPIAFDHFLDKRKLKPEQLESSSLLDLYTTEPPMVEDITEEQMREEWSSIKKAKKQFEEEEAKKMLESGQSAERISKEVQRSGGRVSSGASPLITAENNDGMTIKFDDGTTASTGGNIPQKVVAEEIEVTGSGAGKGIEEMFTDIDQISESERILNSDIK